MIPPLLLRHRFISAVLICLSLFASSASGQSDVQIVFGGGREVPVGGYHILPIDVCNIAMEALSGRLLLTLVLDGATIEDLEAEEPGIDCERVDGASDSTFECTGDQLTLSPQAVIRFFCRMRVEPLTPQGTILVLTALATLANRTTSASVLFRTAGDVSAQPRLQVMIDREDSPSVMRYTFTVWNIGGAPTEGDVDLDVTPATPAPPVDVTDWAPRGSALRYRTRQPLVPAAFFRRTLAFPVVRGRYDVRALAAGGGSPPDEERNLRVLTTRDVEELSAPPPLIFLRGRHF